MKKETGEKSSSVERRRVCIFCGSHPGVRPAYARVAAALGKRLAEQGLGVVTGGAQVGLMGEVARGALEAGGEVIGVIPQWLVDREVAHRGLTQLHVVGSMHERKAMMALLSSAFVALPGGFGTLDELCEMVTWNQIDLHTKRCYLLNTEGYYQGLIDFLRGSEPEGFFASPEKTRLSFCDDLDELMAELLPSQTALA